VDRGGGGHLVKEDAGAAASLPVSEREDTHMLAEACSEPTQSTREQVCRKDSFTSEVYCVTPT
jgi:hypothetical protein